MKARDLLTLKAELKIRSDTELCRRLGVNTTTYMRWMSEPDRDLPRYYALAAAALIHNIEPYHPAPVSPEDLAYYGGNRARKVFGRMETHEDEVKNRMALTPPGS